MQRRQRDSLLLFVGLICLITITESATVTIPIGVILDLDSSLGSTVRDYINIALQDFHDEQSTTRLQPLFRDSKSDLLTAADEAYDLVYKENVSAILGPQSSELASYVVDLGFRNGVPVIWFPPSGPSLLPPHTRFFINSNFSRSHCSQFEAIAAIIENYNWQCVIPIYEDPEFGNDLIPCLTYALQDMDTRVPYISPIRQNFTDAEITKELDRIKDKRTYVFVAHMTMELWSRLLQPAKKAGMMSEGHAWILTQGLSPVLDPKAKDTKEKGYMDGALGVRPSLDVSLERTLMDEHNVNPSLYGLWAYDTVKALANAVQNSGSFDSKESRAQLGNKTSGPELLKAILLKAILETDYEGVSGNFSLRQEQLEPSQFVVYNMKGQRENIIGYWRPETGLFQNYSVDGKPDGKYKLRDPVWPGNTTERPPKLKVGVPTKTHFSEFVNVTTVEGQKILPTGFAVEVFQEVVDALPFPLPYEFVPVDNDNGYDDLLHKNKNLDVIIGDITITTSRANYVYFTMPYLESRVLMVVNVRPDSKNWWILFKPFDWTLWLLLGGIFVAATVFILILESKRRKDDERKFSRLCWNPFLIYKSDVDSLTSDSSKSAVLVVMFVLGIAIQIYTANLTSYLTEMTTAKSSPLNDVQEIRRKNVSVGYQKDSWVKDLLTLKIGLNNEQLKALTSVEEYNEELSKGTGRGGVDVIFDETPYLSLLLSKCSSCKMTGPIYQSAGFAFAFANSSTLASKFSATILNLTQNVTLFGDMKKSITLPLIVDKSKYKSDVEMRSLTTDDFGIFFFPLIYSIFGLVSCILILRVPIIRNWLNARRYSLGRQQAVPPVVPPEGQLSGR
ncbi:hypothetical protein QN277_025179 [Acacia crassicarpa]|uniref:Ionotropic glutamate receptor C-terminal domain-containing protein n=1 Tax=Acacia crassicarpa TaxID=499986 RepID=A0AAE1JGZ9_9FABA|nr:hypothetical protein QN277_025179 [Acacia crassicarpa]